MPIGPNSAAANEDPRESGLLIPAIVFGTDDLARPAVTVSRAFQRVAQEAEDGKRRSATDLVLEAKRPYCLERRTCRRFQWVIAPSSDRREAPDYVRTVLVVNGTGPPAGNLSLAAVVFTTSRGTATERRRLMVEVLGVGRGLTPLAPADQGRGRT